MPNLRLIDVGEATGDLKREYDDAVRRAGKVFNIVKAMCLRPAVLRRDTAVHDAIQVIAYFNYVNRVADAVGSEDEPDWT